MEDKIYLDAAAFGAILRSLGFVLAFILQKGTFFWKGPDMFGCLTLYAFTSCTSVAATLGHRINCHRINCLFPLRLWAHSNTVKVSWIPCAHWAGKKACAWKLFTWVSVWQTSWCVLSLFCIGLQCRSLFCIGLQQMVQVVPITMVNSMMEIQQELLQEVRSHADTMRQHADARVATAQAETRTAQAEARNAQLERRLFQAEAARRAAEADMARFMSDSSRATPPKSRPQPPQPGPSQPQASAAAPPQPCPPRLRATAAAPVLAEPGNAETIPYDMCNVKTQELDTQASIAVSWPNSSFSRKLASASWSLLALASSGAAPRHHVNIH